MHRRTGLGTILYFVLEISSSVAYERDDVNCTSHSDGICRPDQFCTPYEYGDSYDTWCLHCSLCGMPEGAPIDDECPAKCNCQSNADCPRGSICKPYNNIFRDADAKPISTCELCSGDGSSGVGSAGATQCSCASSDECETGYFCGVQDYEFSPNYPTCYRCDDGYGGCADFVLLEGESCQGVCPNQYECSEHAECAGGEFCTQNHRCENCQTGGCWTPARNTLNLDDVWFPLRFSTSVDFGCPRECCDWGLTKQPFWDPYNLATSIGSCEEVVHIEAFWADGDKTGWTAQNFVEKGNACKIERYEFTDGLFPPAVTTVDCIDQLTPPSCSTQQSTMALVQWDSSGPEKIIAFVDSSSKNADNETENSDELINISGDYFPGYHPPVYPLTYLFGARSDTCGLSEAINTLAAWMGIALACIIGVCAIGGVLLCVCCCKRRH